MFISIKSYPSCSQIFDASAMVFGLWPNICIPIGVCDFSNLARLRVF